MKHLKLMLAGVLLGALVLSPTARASDQKPKPKPYLLKTCIVSGDKLGGDMGDPYTFVFEGREIKLCCKGCLKDFKKSSAKFIKQIEVAEAKAAKAPTPGAAPKTGDRK